MGSNITPATNLIAESYATPTQEFMGVTAAKKEWEAILNEAQVPTGPIFHIDEVFKDPQVLQQELYLLPPV